MSAPGENLPSDEEVVRAYLDGESRRSLAKKIGCSTSTVTRRLRRLGTPIRRDVPAAVHIDEERLKDMFAAGMRKEDMAAEFGCSTATVNKNLKKHGIESRPNIRRLSLDASRLREMHEKGMSCGDIAMRVGCSKPTVIDRLRALGIQTHSATPNRIDIDIDSLTEMYRVLSVSEISATLEVSRGTVLNRLREAGIHIRPASSFGRVRKWKPHGCPVKLDSGWEAGVYRILWKEFGDGGFLFQGEFGEREHLCTPSLQLNRPLSLPERYRSKVKTMYEWTPDFVIPSLGWIVEVKGGWKTRQRWNQCVIPCIRSTPDFPFEVYEVRTNPHSIRSFDELIECAINHTV